MKKRIFLVVVLAINFIGLPLFAGCPADNSCDLPQQTGQYGSDGQSGQTDQADQTDQIDQTDQTDQADQSQVSSSDSDTNSDGCSCQSDGGVQVDNVLESLLFLVSSDLKMCESELLCRRYGYFDSVRAIGHINNARSAVSRTRLASGYASLQSEIYDRLGRIRFHLLMNDVRYGIQLCRQLQQVVQSLTNTQSTYSYSNPSLTAPPVLPGYVSSGGWGQGQRIPMYNVPSGVVAVR